MVRRFAVPAPPGRPSRMTNFAPSKSTVAAVVSALVRTIGEAHCAGRADGHGVRGARPQGVNDEWAKSRPCNCLQFQYRRPAESLRIDIGDGGCKRRQVSRQWSDGLQSRKAAPCQPLAEGRRKEKESLMG